MANIVITGASRGLGLEFVKQLSKYSKAPNVLALCRNPESAEKLQSVASSCANIKIIKADMVDFDGYNNVISNIQQQIQGGGINLLINNAGIMLKDTIRNISDKNITESFQVNSMAPLLFTKALLPLLKSADSNVFPLNVGKSAVLNISAHLGSVEENTSGGYLSYRISKDNRHTWLATPGRSYVESTGLSASSANSIKVYKLEATALNMITKSLSVELKPFNIFVMALHPGWVKTDMGGEAAPLTPEVSVNSMLTVLAKADESHRGCLLNSKGKKIPW